MSWVVKSVSTYVKEWREFLVGERKKKGTVEKEKGKKEKYYLTGILC